MLAKAGNRELPHNTRAMAYFVRTIRLLNKYKIKPLIVIMPYHPRALSAFLSVGWGVKERWLENYLRNLQGRLDFKVLNCLKLSTFGGTTDGFYDGAHLTASNSRRLIRYCIAHAPGCFKLPKPPTPTPTPDSEPVAERERIAHAARGGRRRTRRCPKRRACRPTSSNELRPGGAAAAAPPGRVPWAAPRGRPPITRRSAS